MEKLYGSSIIVVVVILSALILFCPNLGLNEKISNVIILVTAGILWWYTKETQELRKINEKLLLSNDQPLLIYKALAKSTDTLPLIKNVGKGTAFEVFLLNYRDNNFFALDMNGAILTVEPKEEFSFKEKTSPVSKNDVCDIYKNINYNILDKIENSGYELAGLFLYKDINNIWYYSLYASSKNKENISKYGLLSEFDFKK